MFPSQKSFLVTTNPYVDRLYVYDNSIEDTEARLLFRLSDGELAKRYVEDLPNWAKIILLK